MYWGGDSENTTSVSKRWTNSRGDVEVLAIVLLIGFVSLVGVGTLLVAGDAVDSIESRSEYENSKSSFTEFNSRLESERVSQDSKNDINFGVDQNGVQVDPDAGEITVEITGATTCTIVDEESLGTVWHENGGNEIAMQGGGVWEYDGTTSRMISPPNIQYTGEANRETLGLSISTVEGDQQSTDQLSFSHEETISKQLSDECGISEANPLADSEMVITVESKYADGWRQFFKNEIGNSVSQPSDEIVKVTLEGPITSGKVEGPIVSDAASLALSNNGKIDSYDSSEGQYTSPGGENAPVITEGDFNPSNNIEVGGNVNAGGGANIANNILVTGETRIGGDSSVSNNPEFEGTYSTNGSMQNWGGTYHDDVIVGEYVEQFGNVELYGDLHVGGDVDDLHNAEIYGDVIAGGSVSASGATIDGEVYEDGERTPREPLEPQIEQPELVDDKIENKRSEIAASNDNDETGVINGNELVDCSTTCTLKNGTYYLNEIDFYQEQLELDTSDGPIELYVENGITLSQGGSEETQIEVTGDAGVEVYLNGDLSMSGESQVTVPGDRSPLFWLNLHSDNRATFSNKAVFVGIVNSPGSESTSGGDISISNSVEVFGALVGNIDGTSNQNEIHFDEALIESHALGEEEENNRLSYTSVEITKSNLESE